MNLTCGKSKEIPTPGNGRKAREIPSQPGAASGEAPDGAGHPVVSETEVGAARESPIAGGSSPSHSEASIVARNRDPLEKRKKEAKSQNTRRGLSKEVRKGDVYRAWTRVTGFADVH